MKNRISKKLFGRLLLITLSLLLSLSALASCKAREVPAGKLANTVVGTVNGNDVYYDELYFLASNYLAGMKNKYGDDTEAIRDALDKAVKENIIANYAILSLCEENGLSINDSSIEAEVDDYIELLIETDFMGHRSFYLDSIEEVGLTDRYVRFLSAVDILYSKLPTIYAENGLVSSDEDEIIDYVKENFVRVWHVMIANDSGDNVEKNKANAESLLLDIRSGETDMYGAIGGKYNEDFSLPAEGYCFAKGSMEKPYEEAAFALEVGEISDVVEAFGETGMGEYVNCYYIIQRLSISDQYIDMYYEELVTEYQNSIIMSDLDEHIASLSFTPNEFYNSLDLSALEAPKAGIDVLVVIIIAASVIVVAAISVTVLLVIKKRKKSKALTK